MNNQITSQEDLLLLTLISVTPCLLLGYLSVGAPDALVGQLEFWYSDPTLISIWGSSLIHFSTSHLINNLSAYLAVVVPTYAIFSLRNQLRAFWWGFLGLAVTTPPVVRGIDWLILAKHFELVAPTATARGFSGLVSAVAGMLLASSLLTLHDRHGIWTVSTVLFLMLCSLTGYVALVNPTVPTALFAVALIGMIGCIHRHTKTIHGFYELLKRATTNELEISIALAVACTFLIAIVPIDPINNGTFSGVIAHGVGVSYGVILTTASIHLYQIATRQPPTD